MASCNECICSEVCYYKSFNDVRNLKKRRSDVEKICKSFVHRDSLKDAPTVDAVEVVHGRWEDVYGGKYANPRYVCSVCKEKSTYTFVRGLLGGYKEMQALTPYCHNCGAMMDGDGNG